MATIIEHIATHCEESWGMTFEEWLNEKVIVEWGEDVGEDVYRTRRQLLYEEILGYEAAAVTPSRLIRIEKTDPRA